MNRQTRKKSVSQAFFAHTRVALTAIALLGFMLPVKAAEAETRSLKLYYVHTHEKAEIVFKKNGRYVDTGLKKLNYFLRDWRRNEPTNMDPRLFDLIWQVYQLSGSRNSIHVISAYRSPKTNNMLRSRSANTGVAKNSQHTLGKAMDFYLPDVNLSRLRQIGLKQQGGGVGYYPKSGSPFVHMDVGRVRHWPRMNRKELMALFPDGKTMHIPSDGKPLARYEQAVAEVKARKGQLPQIAIARNDSDDKPKKSGGLLASLFGKKQNNNDTSRQRVVTTRTPEATPAPGLGNDDSAETTVVSLPDSDAPVPAVSPLRTAPQENDANDNGAFPEAPDAETVIAEAPVPVPEAKPEIRVAQEPEVAGSQAGTQVAMNTAPEAAPASGNQSVAMAKKGDEIAAAIAHSSMQTAFASEKKPIRARDEVNALISQNNDVIPLPDEDRYDSGYGAVSTSAKGAEDRAVVRMASVDKAAIKSSVQQAAVKPVRVDNQPAHQPEVARAPVADADQQTVASIPTRTTPKSDKPQIDDLARLITDDQSARQGGHTTAEEEIRQIPDMVFASGLQKLGSKPSLTAQLTGKAINFRAVARINDTF